MKPIITDNIPNIPGAFKVPCFICWGMIAIQLAREVEIDGRRVYVHEKCWAKNGS